MFELSTLCSFCQKLISESPTDVSGPRATTSGGDRVLVEEGTGIDCLIFSAISSFHRSSADTMPPNVLALHSSESAQTPDCACEAPTAPPPIVQAHNVIRTP